jgi:hypothetical protein
LNTRIVSEASDSDPDPQFLPTIVVYQVLENCLKRFSMEGIVWLGVVHLLFNDLLQTRSLLVDNFVMAGQIAVVNKLSTRWHGMVNHKLSVFVRIPDFDADRRMILLPDAKHFIGEGLAHRLHTFEIKNHRLEFF